MAPLVWVHGGWLGNGLPPRAGHAAVHEGRNPQRSKSGRDRNSYKSAPGHDTQRTETTSPIQRRHARIGRRHVDERPAFRDIDRTCVPGTVWGTASNRTAKSRSTPCLSLKRPSLPQHPPRRQDAITRRRINLSHAPSRLGKPKRSRQARNRAIYARIFTAIDMGQRRELQCPQRLGRKKKLLSHFIVRQHDAPS